MPSFATHTLKNLVFALTGLLLFAAPMAMASESEGEKFNPGELILHHVADAHDWHFATIGNHHYTIYLPVIAYTPGVGVSTFSSTCLHAHHGSEEQGTQVHTVDQPVQHAGFYLDEHEHLQRVDKQKFYDFSITKNVASMFLSVIILFTVFISVAGSYNKRGLQKPTGLQSFLEPVIIFVRDEIAKPNIGPKYGRYLPYLLTIFFYIWVNNLLGLLPGGANLTGNIAVTLTLSVITFLITTFSGNKDYWKHIYNTPGVPWWLKFPVPLMPVVEFIGIFTKPFSLMIRLFANITAGHIIILSLLSLIFIFNSYAIGVV